MSKTRKKTARKKATPGLEKALDELEGLVEKMEQGDLSLEQALKDFQRGIELTRACRKALQEAEQKISILQQQAGLDELAEFVDDEH